MPETYSVLENGLIRRAGDGSDPPDGLNGIVVPADTFDALKSFITESETESVMTFFWQKGRECIRLKNYVGLLETRDGSRIEILPKITAAGENGAVQSRAILLKMLQHLRGSPFCRAGFAGFRSERLPLWEVFVALFLDEVSTLLAQGLRTSYVSESGTQPFLRGKLNLADQLRRAAYEADRFSVTYDEQTTDLPQNRLLKSALRFVAGRSVDRTNQSRIRQLLFVLDDLPPSSQVQKDLQAARTQNRLFSRYEPALRWAEALLGGRAFGISGGENQCLTLLFPMDRLFEDYVAAGFRRYAGEGEVSIQESSRHLVDDHSGVQKFRLRPDIVIRRNGLVTVLDTKWKRIEPTNPTGNYGLDQADLYQLYAYGKKYGASELVLIYPAGESFRSPLNGFGYDPTMQLRVVPFDLTRPMEEEVLKIMSTG
ncbi:McrC family protein [Larkinella soli]|uniref:McrC family protein n=1 Tax=Larkinella soli TaxID=1770527 RepID=UPI000FFCA6E0|nr:McrC family protein [Larkinella soli]